MPTKNQAYVLLSVAICCFLLGRYLVPYKKVTTVTKDTNVRTITKVVTVTVREPSGATTTTQTTTTTKDKDVDQRQNTTEVSSRDAGVVVSLKVATNVPHLGVVYGVGVDKDILGPLSIGVYGFTNGMVGASIGLRF